LARKTSPLLKIPALSILDGKLVVVGKDRDYEPIEDENGEPVDPVSFLEELVRRHGEIVYINDIDGMENNSPQYNFMKNLVGIAELWVDAGSRSGDALIDVIFAGARRAVLSTKSIGALDDIAEALEVSDSIILCIDYDKGIIARNRELSKMTPRKVAEAAMSAGLEDIVFADHGRRKKDSVRTEMIMDLVSSGIGVYVAGNIVEKDLPSLEKVGARGALLDMTEIIKRW